MDNNKNDELKSIATKRKKFFSIIFLIGCIVTGCIFIIGLLVNEVDYQFLFDFIICSIGLYYCKNKKYNNNISNNSSDNLDTVENDYIDSLHKKINITWEKNMIDNSKAVLIISLIFTIILIVLFIFVINSNISLNAGMSSFIETYGFLILIFVCLFIPIGIKYYYQFTIKERGKTTFKINIIGNPLENNEKMKKILDYLYYKECKYKNMKVYYAYKTRTYKSNISSVKRYLTYEVKDNYIEINCWIVVFGMELPLLIENKLCGIHHRKALINDIKFIKENFKMQ